MQNCRMAILEPIVVDTRDLTIDTGNRVGKTHEPTEISPWTDSVALVAALACLSFQPAHQSPVPFREPVPTQVSAEKTHAILQCDTGKRHPIQLHQVAFPSTRGPPVWKPARTIIVHKVKLRLFPVYRDQQIVSNQVAVDKAEPMKPPHQFR